MNSGTGVFTSQDNGTWYFSFTGWVHLPGAKNYGLQIVKNNVQLQASYLRDEKSTGKYSYVSIAMSVMAQLNNGDKISVRVNHKDGGSYLYQSSFIGIKL